MRTNRVDQAEAFRAVVTTTWPSQEPSRQAFGPYSRKGLADTAAKRHSYVPKYLRDRGVTIDVVVERAALTWEAVE